MNVIKGIIEDCNKSDLVSDKVIKKVIEIIGQEEWNDLHDEYSDICTTMGELIITLKGITDLEQENLELKEQIEKMKCCGNCMYFDFNQPNYCNKGVYREVLYVCGKWVFGN